MTPDSKRFLHPEAIRRIGRLEIRARQVVVEGTVEGAIAASLRIELTATAKVNGSLTAERVVIAEGARFNGGVDMGRRTIATKVAQYKAGQTAASA